MLSPVFFLHSYLIRLHLIFYLDVNECEMLNGGCQHRCRNTNGSYSCQCNDGFFLNGNGRTCIGKFEREFVIWKSFSSQLKQKIKLDLRSKFMCLLGRIYCDILMLLKFHCNALL